MTLSVWCVRACMHVGVWVNCMKQCQGHYSKWPLPHTTKALSRILVKNEFSSVYERVLLVCIRAFQLKWKAFQTTMCSQHWFLWNNWKYKVGSWLGWDTHTLDGQQCCRSCGQLQLQVKERTAIGSDIGDQAQNEFIIIKRGKEGRKKIRAKNKIGKDN